MLGQVKNNKGFNLLELIVVIAIVGFISAVSYPSFSSWNKERKIRAAVKEVAALVRNAIVQTERGTFAYVQVLFSNTADTLIIESRGMTMASLVTKMNDGADAWDTAPSERCDTAAGNSSSDDNYWDTDNLSTSNEIKNAVYTIELKDVTTNFFGERAAAVCFAKNCFLGPVSLCTLLVFAWPTPRKQSLHPGRGTVSLTLDTHCRRAGAND